MIRILYNLKVCCPVTPVIRMCLEPYKFILTPCFFMVKFTSNIALSSTSRSFKCVPSFRFPDQNIYYQFLDLHIFTSVLKVVTRLTEYNEPTNAHLYIIKH
jgi:hypothetical protein